MRFHRLLLALLVAAALLSSLAAACSRPSSPPVSGKPAARREVETETPPAPTPGRVRYLGEGEPERFDVLDALRPLMERDLGQPVRFDVVTVNEAAPFAAVMGFAITPDGRDVDYRAIPQYKAWVESEAFDREFCALLRYEHSAWSVLVWQVGATDAVNTEWSQQYHLPAKIWNAPPFEQ